MRDVAKLLNFFEQVRCHHDFGLLNESRQDCLRWCCRLDYTGIAKVA